MQETARRREIEDVASVLFREHGYSGTSVRDIARALDIQGASLYAHVASKQDVLWAIVDRMAERFEAAANTALAPIAPTTDSATSPSGDAVERLTALVRGHVEVVTDDVGRASVFVREWRSLTPERRAEIGRRRDAYERRFRTVIREGTESGAFVDVDAATAAAFLLTALNGIVTWYRPDGRLRPATLADAYAELALRSVTDPGVAGA